MTDPFAAFLRTICERPDDDTPRLIYADWLDENGQRERAEFIRVQIELARWDNFRGRSFAQFLAGQQRFHTDRVDDVRFFEDQIENLRQRERELLNDDNRTLWFGMSGLGVQLEGDGQTLFWLIQPSGPRIKARISRGFVSSVSLSCADFMWHAKAIFDAQPVVLVALSDRRPQPDATGGHRCAWQCQSSERDLPSWIPFGLLDLLSEGGYDGQTWKVYDTTDDAQSALSTACVAHGRNLAGLPPLARAVAAKK